MKSKTNFLLFFIIFISSLFCSSDGFTNWGESILHHVGNPHTIWGDNYEFISKPVIMLFIAALVTIIMSLLATRKYRKNINAKPSGLSQIYEILMDFINKEIVIPNIGKNYAKSWAPLAMTFFVFILTCNLLGLIPFFEKLNLHTIGNDGAIKGGGSTVTANFGVTMGLAVITFFAIIIAGTKKHGFLGYWKSMIPSGVPKPVLIILIPIEIMGMFVRPFALMMRLGANMTAGHIGMIAIFALPIILSGGVDKYFDSTLQINLFMGLFAGFAAIILNVGIYFLEFIVCLVQAYVFTLLSSVFIGMAIHADH